MRNLASLVLSILVLVIGIWLVLKLLGAALKLVGILIVIALAAGAYFVLRGLIDGGRRRD